jgi:hypothetical protein
MPALEASPLRWPPAPISPSIFLPMALGAAVQIYRYHHYSTSQQQQQTKWIAYGLALATAGLLGYRWLIPSLWPQVVQPGMEHLLYWIFRPLHLSRIGCEPFRRTEAQQLAKLSDAASGRTRLHGLTGGVSARMTRCYFLSSRANSPNDCCFRHMHQV